MQRSLIRSLSLAFLGWAATGLATAQVTNHGSVTSFALPSKAPQAEAGVDFVHAKPMPLPAVAPRSETAAHYDLIDALSGQASMGAPGFSAGGDGSGHATLTPINLGASSVDSLDVTPEEAGTNNHPFSTARADAYTGTTNTLYPFRASGRLFFKIGSDTFVCSASLIKRGVVVTAAHCVANYGKKQFYSGWQFVPGYRNGVAPYGVWTVKKAYVPTAYYNGTDSCAVAGVVCQDDVAVLVLNASSAGAYIGTTIGWYGYGWNGYGFTSNALTEVTQIGYPVCLDSGLFMERNDSYGYRSSSNSNNTMIGSLMCGGSSGGPWLVNFGFRPTLTGTTAGTSPAPNTVIGVTSWGYVSSSPKEQGASPFLSTNIVPLVNTACTATAAAC